MEFKIVIFKLSSFAEEISVIEWLGVRKKVEHLVLNCNIQFSHWFSNTISQGTCLNCVSRIKPPRKQNHGKDQIFGTLRVDLKCDSTQFHQLGGLNPWKKMNEKMKDR